MANLTFLVLCLANLNEAFNATFLWPFVCELVWSFDQNADTFPMRVGFLASSYYLGQFVNSKLAPVVQKIGKRTSLLCSMLFSAVCVVIVGLQFSYAVTILARFLS